MSARPTKPRPILSPRPNGLVSYVRHRNPRRKRPHSDPSGPQLRTGVPSRRQRSRRLSRFAGRTAPRRRGAHHRRRRVGTPLRLRRAYRTRSRLRGNGRAGTRNRNRDSRSHRRDRAARRIRSRPQPAVLLFSVGRRVENERVVFEVVFDVVGVFFQRFELLAEHMPGRVVAEVLGEFDMLAIALDHVAHYSEVVRQRGPDVVDVLVFRFDCGVFGQRGHARVWDATEGLQAFGDLVGGGFDVLVDLLQENVDVTELRALDVPVVFVQLVVQHVGVGQIGVESVDDLFGLLLVESERVFVDGPGFLIRRLLGTHYTPRLVRTRLNTFQLLYKFSLHLNSVRVFELSTGRIFNLLCHHNSTVIY